MTVDQLGRAAAMLVAGLDDEAIERATGLQLIDLILLRAEAAAAPSRHAVRVASAYVPATTPDEKPRREASRGF